MLEKILIPTDLSTESNSVFPYAVTLAQVFNSRLYLVHVMHPDDRIRARDAAGNEAAHDQFARRGEQCRLVRLQQTEDVPE